MDEVIIEGLKQRDDLRPRRGWSTNPNVYRDPTHYEVLGTGLAVKRSVRAAIEEWLVKNKPNLTVGMHNTSCTTTEVVLTHTNGTWFVVSYFTYSGG